MPDERRPVSLAAVRIVVVEVDVFPECPGSHQMLGSLDLSKVFEHPIERWWRDHVER